MATTSFVGGRLRVTHSDGYRATSMRTRSVDPGDANRMTVTCKTGADEYKKHFLGKSDNVTWFAEQLEGANVSPDRYKVTFKPTTIIPDPQLR